MKILLLGNPNVGKSVVFTRLTNAYVIAANYPGATVEFTQGELCYSGKCYPVIDVPGTYTLNPTCPAEEVACQMLASIEKDDIIINVIDSTNIERSLNLTVQLIKKNIKMIAVLNMSDEAKHHGITIDYEKLESILDIPCIPIIAITGEGIKKLVEEIPNARRSKLFNSLIQESEQVNLEETPNEINTKSSIHQAIRDHIHEHHPESLNKIHNSIREHIHNHHTKKSFNYNHKAKSCKFSNAECDRQHWQVIGDIIEAAVTFEHRHHTIGETIRDLTVRPLTGLPVAVIILAGCFYIIRLIGESLISYVFDPIFEKLWLPLLYKLSSALGGGGIFHDILVGKLVMPDSSILGDYVQPGVIHFHQSLGLLSTGLYVPLAMVLPYVFAFYLLLSFLEDSGYLPRLGVLLDSVMHKFGLHGLSIIPMMLAVGCNVPGVLSTRILETKRERFITIVMMSICIPCMSQIAVVFGLLGQYGIKPLFIVFGTLFLLWIILGIVLQKIRKGTSPEIFVEIPPYRLPYFKGMFKKVSMRLQGFLKEAVPFVLLGVLLMNILFALGIIDFFGKLMQPIITGLLGLPKESIAAIIIGFFRKDVAVGMLAPLGMSMKQLVIASIVLTMYFPCIATFVVILKELGIRDLIFATIIMISTSLMVGTLLNLIPAGFFV